MKRLAWIMVTVVAIWAGASDRADASCAGSHITVMAAAKPVEKIISAVWEIEPVCNVIETGVLLGTDSNALAPVGEPIYGHRQSYSQEVSVSQGGAYWVAAYVKDELGNFIQSSPWPIYVMGPTAFLLTPGGSHDDPPSYTKTDDDFLRPAKDPHFAMIKNFIREGQIHRVTNNRILTDQGVRQVANTERDAVLSQLVGPFVFLDVQKTFDPAGISSSLDFIDRLYDRTTFPRAGLYGVVCQFFGSNKGCSHMGIILNLFMIFTDFRIDDFDTSNSVRSEFRQFDRNSVTYFIPPVSGSGRMTDAKLRLSYRALARRQDVPSGLLMNGKPPTEATTSCVGGIFGFPELADCQGIATWDLTEEAKSLATQGGGELAITPNLASLFQGERSIGDTIRTESWGQLHVTPPCCQLPVGT